MSGRVFWRASARPKWCPLSAFEFYEIGVRGLGISTWVFLESSDPSSTWRKVVRHVGTTAGLCSAESGQGQARWVRPSGVGSSRPGGVPQSLHNGPFPTAPSRLIPSAHGEFWAKGLRASGPKHHPSATHCPLTTCVLGRSGSELVSAHLGRWSIKQTVQARIDPSRSTGWRVRIATHLLPSPASSCHYLLRGTFCSREIPSMSSPMLRCNARKWAHGWCIVGSITRAREFLQEKTRRRIFTHTEQSVVWGRGVVPGMSITSVRPG